MGYFPLKTEALTEYHDHQLKMWGWNLAPSLAGLIFVIYHIRRMSFGSHNVQKRNPEPLTWARHILIWSVEKQWLSNACRDGDTWG